MDEELVCVLCGIKWRPRANVCTCGGFCSWGDKMGGPPSSWNIQNDGAWTPKPVPKDVIKPK